MFYVVDTVPVPGLRALIYARPTPEDHVMTAPQRPSVWDWLLLGVVGVVAAYALGLVVAGLFLGDHVFDLLGFGPDDGQVMSEVSRKYLHLVYGVLGAAIVGWMVTIGTLVRGPLLRRERWAWNAIAVSVSAWFVLDTGLSLVLGFAGHALFNVVFITALVVPLAAIRRDFH